MGGHGVRTAVCTPRTGASGGASPAHTVMLDFWPPEPGDHKPLFFKPRSVVFVMAAWADSDIHTVWLCGAGFFPPLCHFPQP